MRINLRLVYDLLYSIKFVLIYYCTHLPPLIACRVTVGSRKTGAAGKGEKPRKGNQMATVEWKQRSDFVWPEKFRLVQVADFEEAQEEVKTRNCVDAFYVEGRGDYKASCNYLVLVIA